VGGLQYPTIPATTTITTTTELPPQPNVSTGQLYSSNQIVEYTLRLVNQVRLQNGLQSVTLSNNTSGQQHAESMLQYDYFSHWDPAGMKPYMRYTLLGGLGVVDENIAFRKYVQETCLGSSCTIIPINVTESISDMENQMLYNDSLCCNNGHKMNILDPNHNQISIGIAYNNTTVFLVEDLINNYIGWTSNTPSVYYGNVSLKGYTASGIGLSAVQITYEPLPTYMTISQLNSTRSYSYGTTIAGVTYGKYYYPNISTIYATNYYTRRNYFDVEFSMSQLESQYGAGAYTLMIYLNNSTNDEFLGSTYTMFVNKNGIILTPNNI
jgi:uncharacterized protein YkwD